MLLNYIPENPCFYCQAFFFSKFSVRIEETPSKLVIVASTPATWVSHEIWGFRCGDYSDYGILESDTIVTGTNV
jgi:hypothetical protein